MTAVALCASFPSGERAEHVRPYYSVDIALAAGAVAEAALRSRAELVFGAHPTISPIILHTARLLNAGPQVKIYQSEFFDDQTTEAVQQLVADLGAEFRATASTGDRTSSLTAMRREMFAGRPRAAFFCGGMDGLDEEFALAADVGAARYLFVEPGGRAAKLARDSENQPPTANAPVALYGRAYGSLALEALESIGVSGTEVTGPHEEEMLRPEDEL